MSHWVAFAGSRFQAAVQAISSPPRPELELPRPTAHRVRGASWWLCGALVVLCFAPRLWMFFEVRYLCPDAVHYVRAAESIDQGKPAPELGNIRFNTLTLGMVALHHCGLDFETAGQLWNLLFSTLAILPLYGWVRRQFDERAAILSAILYAVHPSLIENSAEVIRDPGFWFLYLMGLYMFWRAASERRALFLVLGVAAAGLSILTRFEGFLLAIPCLGWLAVSLCSGGENRRRLGIAVALIVLGGTVGGLVVSEYLGVRASQVIRLDPLHRLAHWFRTWQENVPPGNLATGGEALAPADDSPLIVTFVKSVGRALEPAFFLLALASVFAWRGLWWRRDILPLLTLACAIVAASWIHLSYAGQMSSRYLLPVFLALCPLCSLGLSWPRARRPGNSPGLDAMVICLLTGVIAVVGLCDALGSNFENRAVQADLGRWLAEQYGGHPRISAPAAGSTVITYYAQADVQAVPWNTPERELLPAITLYRPDVVVLSREQEALANKLVTADELNLHAVPERLVPPGAEQFRFLLRGDKVAIFERRALENAGRSARAANDWRR